MESELNRVVVLIPAYKPGFAMTEVSRDLLGQGFQAVVVIDDGSGEKYRDLFRMAEDIGCRVVTHDVNKGKGVAIKTGIKYIMDNYADIDGVVTADADGQHLVGDIVRVAQEMLKQPEAIILGGRKFSGKVPLKSRMGNAITKNIFNFLSGQRVHDTQTGLRGLPTSSFKDLLALPGERYEYEMNMLLEASKLNLTLKEIDIETVYIDDNSGSHFNPLTDSWRIYKRILMFGASSMAAFLIDFLVFTLMTIWVPSVLWVAVVSARIISSFVNFLINRHVIFAKKDKAGMSRHLFGYYALVVVIMALNYGIISGLTAIGLNVYVAKIIAEVLLFFVSFFVQRRMIFK